MQAIISQLENDHSYMLKLIYQLSKQTKSLSGLNHEKVDIDTLLEIIQYMKDFPKHFHHPIEEAMLGLLGSKKLGFKDLGLIAKAIDEHILLDALSELLDIKVSAFLSDNINKADFLKTVDRFCRQQMKHIAYEHDYIFPLCEQHLHADDWVAIQQKAAIAEKHNTELEQYCNRRKVISEAHLVTAKHAFS